MPIPHLGFFQCSYGILSINNPNRFMDWASIRGRNLAAAFQLCIEFISSNGIKFLYDLITAQAYRSQFNIGKAAGSIVGCLLRRIERGLYCGPIKRMMSRFMDGY